MSNRFFTNNLRLLSLLVLGFGCISLQAVPVNWTNLSTPSSVGFTSVNLVDPVIELEPNNPMTNILTTGVTTDLNVVLNQDTIIRGNSAGNSRLYIYAGGNNKAVIFDLTQYNLRFEGSANGDDLLIAVQGRGQVIFNFGGGKQLVLAANSAVANGGSVQMYRQLDETAANLFATLTFIRAATDPDPNADVEVVVQDGSILSYLGYTAQPNAPSTENAVITFGTSNTGSGRMILTIGQLGAVIVRGRLLTNVTPPVDYTQQYTLTDINSATPAGFNAIFDIVNTDSTSSGSLLVQNYNNTLGEFIWDPWCNLDVRSNPPFGNFNGVQWGFVVGSYGTLSVGGYSYLDYVSLTGTQCLNIPSLPDSSSRIKARNPSALFTDGQPDSSFVAPQIIIGQTGQPAGLFFRSGVDNFGSIRPLSDPNPFTIDQENRTPGAGFPVFDIEGPLNVTGYNTGAQEFSGIELLSLEVDPTGGSLFVGDGQTIFPLRTFATESVTDHCTGIEKTSYISYNNACFLNNGRVNLQSASIIHTDQNHQVFEDNDVASEPAYIGGETWLLQSCVGCIAKPKWAFYNSRFDVQMSVALTGVDLLVPNGSDHITPCGANLSQFAFYQNGKAIDHGNGRNMILGTYIGSTACDGCTVLDKDAQLDVMQDQNCDSDPSEQQLQLVNGVNDDTIVQGITGDISQQYSIQTIYLGNNSNISVGTQGNTGTTMSVTVTAQSTFPLITSPVLTINGNFFSFETRGGENGLPATSNVTGQGGIFVDTNGTFEIGNLVCGYRTNIGAMVTKSSNGVINLPSNRVFFDPTVGIATWNLDLNDLNQWVIVPSGVEYEEYNLNWMFTIKDYNLFMPYYLTDCYNPCVCPPVTDMNVTAIPEVQGIVQQFNIQGSRIGDPVHLKVNGGTIEELVMLVGFNSAEAPVGVLVLENDAKVGLGSTHRNVDSLHASVQLGVNGINIIMNSGNATVELNEDIVINNICSILPGPEISANSVLRFTSDCCKTLRVTKDGILDLSGFEEGQVVEFGGNVRVVFEPGATVIYGSGLGAGPTLRFAEQSTCLFEPVVNLDDIFGQDLTGTDTVRVVFTGIGILEFAECSRADVPRNSFVGIESLATCNISGADIRLRITDSGAFYIGDTDCRTPGGVFQVGNTIPLSMGTDPVITFSLILDGPHAKFEVGPQGFLGLGVGIVNKPASGHDNWLIAQAYNLSNISLDLPNGIFRHAQLYAGTDDRSALIAVADSLLGAVNPFNFNSNPLPGTAPDKYSASLLSNTNILGGGNFVAALATGAVAFAPVVDDVNGDINSGQYAAGILASMPILQEPTFQDASAQEMQLLLRAQDILLLAPTTNRAVAAPSDLVNQVRIGYIDSANLPGYEGSIGRIDVINILGKTPQTVVQQHTLQIGVAQVTPTSLSQGNNPPRPILAVNELGN